MCKNKMVSAKAEKSVPFEFEKLTAHEETAREDPSMVHWNDISSA
jgi:hypothetical protein